MLIVSKEAALLVKRTMDTHKSRTSNSPVSRLFDTGFLVCALIAIALWMLMPDLDARDFTLFWQATARLLHGTNPYVADVGEISLNSPFGLGLFWFFGALKYHAAKQLYLILMHFAFFWSIWVGYKVFWAPSSPSAALNLSLLIMAIPLGMIFQVIAWGSLTVFALIGILAFYCLDAKHTPLLSGCCLALCLIKPHLFVLALIWVFWWSIRHRKILLPMGFLMLTLLAGFIALSVQPNIFHMYANIPDRELFTMAKASIGNVLYALFQQKHAIVLFIPLIVGIALLPIIRTWLRSADLRLSFALLLPWSVHLSPYCWGHDYLACFATPFIAASLLSNSIDGLKYGRSLLMGIAIIATFVVGTVLSPWFRFETFAIYGFLLVLMSAMLFCLNPRLKTDI